MRSLLSSIIELRPEIDQAKLKKAGRDASESLSGEFDKFSKNAQADVEQVGKKLDSVFSKDRTAAISNAGQKMTVGLTAPIAAGFGLAVKNASDLNETMSASQVIFGKSAQSVDAWANSSIDNLGMAKGTALEAANALGVLLKGSGLAQEDAAKMSQTLVERGRDIKSFYNASSTQEVMDAFNQALRGEAEAVRKYGIDVSQAALEAEALAAGLVKANVPMAKVKDLQLKSAEASKKAAVALKEHGEGSAEYTKAAAAQESAEASLAKALEGKVPDLTKTQKAQAAYNIMLRESKDAAGDYTKTQGGVANSSEKAREQLKGLSATMGTQLLPAAVKVMGAITGVLSKFSAMSPETQKVIMVVLGLVATIGPLLIVTAKLIEAIKVVRTVMLALNASLLLNPFVLLAVAVVALLVLIYKFRGEIMAVLGQVAAAAAAWAGSVKASISAFILGAKTTITEAFTAVAVFFAGVYTRVTGLFGSIGDAISGAFGAVVGTVRGILNELIGFWEGAVNRIIDGANLAARGINAITPGNAVGQIGSAQLPRLAQGGNIRRGGSVVVGDGGNGSGAEVLTLPRGASVTPLAGRQPFGGNGDSELASAVARLASQVAELAAQPRVVNLELPQSADARELARRLAAADRDARARRYQTTRR